MKDINVEVIPLAEGVKLCFEGALTISHAQRIKTALLEAWHHDPIVVSCSHPSAIDLSILQLLTAAKKTAHHSGKQLLIDIKLTDELETLVRQAGFQELIISSAKPH